MADDNPEIVNYHRWVEWTEPYSDGAEGVIMRMSEAEIAAVQMRREPRYTSVEQAVLDFMVVHWAYFVFYPIDGDKDEVRAPLAHPDKSWRCTNPPHAC